MVTYLGMSGESRTPGQMVTLGVWLVYEKNHTLHLEDGQTPYILLIIIIKPIIREA